MKTTVKEEFMIDLCRTAIVIPSFEPDKSLTDYVYSLLKAGFCNIIVIDDGSNEEYQEIFRNLEKPANKKSRGN